VARAGSLLGSASIIVLDDTVDMVWVADRVTRFFEHESCGKCSPCREGTYWMRKLYERIGSGRGRGEDVALLADVLREVDGKCFCPLGEFSLAIPRSTLAHFGDEYERAVGHPVARAAGSLA
jgi:NADH-quinone oxidoreductase subunit F